MRGRIAEGVVCEIAAAANELDQGMAAEVCGREALTNAVVERAAAGAEDDRRVFGEQAFLDCSAGNGNHVVEQPVDVRDVTENALEAFDPRERKTRRFRDSAGNGQGTVAIARTSSAARHANFDENTERPGNRRPLFDMAVHSADLLARTLRSGVRPRMVARTLPIVWPPTGTGTAVSPMRPMEVEARRIEARHPEIFAVNIVGGYAFADTPDTGVSISVVTTGTDAAAQAYLDRLAVIADAYKLDGVPREWDIDAAIDDARGVTGTVALVEPADNIGGGSPGDCTSILRTLLKRQLPKSAVVINDPRAVEMLFAVEVGHLQQLTLGGSSTLDPGPVDLKATLLSRSDGRFTLEDRNSHLAAMQGIHIDMGPCATVRSGGVDILVTSKKTPPFDLGQLRSQGIVPETLRFVGVKAAVAHKRAYDRITAASYWVNTPGPCPSDLTRLPYRHLRRPVFPLDLDIRR